MNLVPAGRLTYVAHPLGAGPDREANRARASRWVAWAAKQGFVPVATWIALSGVWEETLENRLFGLECDKRLIARCDLVLLVGGRVSPGMRIEQDFAHAVGVEVHDLTALGPEPPEAV